MELFGLSVQKKLLAQYPTSAQKYNYVSMNLHLILLISFCNCRKQVLMRKCSTTSLCSLNSSVKCAKLVHSFDMRLYMFRVIIVAVLENIFPLRKH